MAIHLFGGGWAEDESSWTGRFFEDARARAGRKPKIACVLWARSEEEGKPWASEYAQDLGEYDAEVSIVQLTEDRVLEAADLADVDAIFIGGGHTPGYHRAVMPLADTLRGLVASGVPYGGYSAGAMIAGDTALLGGWQIGGVPVTPERNGEGLTELSLDAGLGLIDLVVDVHAAQEGTLSRMVAAVDAGLVPQAVAIDEKTSLIVSAGGIEVAGEGNVWSVQPGEHGATVTVLAGTR